MSTMEHEWQAVVRAVNNIKDLTEAIGRLETRLAAVEKTITTEKDGPYAWSSDDCGPVLAGVDADGDKYSVSTGGGNIFIEGQNSSPIHAMRAYLAKLDEDG